MIVFCMMALIGVAEMRIAFPPSDDTSDTNCDENEIQPPYKFPYKCRKEWGARPPAHELTPLNISVPYVVIHHSYIPKACYNNGQCVDAMKAMQNMHIDKNQWWDIGYHFGVGSNGVAYEGRGWRKVGAHALHFNTVSIGICLIGDWSQTLPTAAQTETAQGIIDAGVKLGFIRPDYKLVGHRQVRDTKCPGDALYQEIQGWPHYATFPRTHNDLLDVPELPEDVKEIIRKQEQQ